MIPKPGQTKTWTGERAAWQHGTCYSLGQGECWQMGGVRRTGDEYPTKAECRHAWGDAIIGVLRLENGRWLAYPDDTPSPYTIYSPSYPTRRMALRRAVNFVILRARNTYRSGGPAPFENTAERANTIIAWALRVLNRPARRVKPRASVPSPPTWAGTPIGRLLWQNTG